MTSSQSHQTSVTWSHVFNVERKATHKIPRHTSQSSGDVLTWPQFCRLQILGSAPSIPFSQASCTNSVQRKDMSSTLGIFLRVYLRLTRLDILWSPRPFRRFNFCAEAVEVTCRYANRVWTC